MPEGEELVTGHRKESSSSSGGCTVQHMELQGLADCTCITRRVVDALGFQIRSVTFIGDSICCIMVLRQDCIHCKAYFQNTSSEVSEHRQALEQLVDRVMLRAASTWHNFLPSLQGVLETCKLVECGKTCFSPKTP